MRTFPSKPVYTSCEFNERLGKFDRFEFQCIVDNVTTSPDSLDIYVEHSPDGEHWLHPNGLGDNPPVQGGGEVHWLAGALSTVVPNPAAGSATGPLFAFVRFQIFFGATGTGAHVKITVTPRDSR